MPETPWDLTFAPDPGMPVEAGVRIVALEGEYDAVALHAFARNETAGPVAVDRITLRAPLDLPSASALAWTAAPEPGITRLDDLDFGARLSGDDLLVIEAPVRATPVLLAGLTSFDSHRATLTVTIDESGEAIASLAVTFDLESATLAPGEELALPPVRLAQGTDATELLDEWGHAVEAAMGVSAPVLGASCWRAPAGADLPTLAAGINGLAEAGYDLSTIILPVELEPGAGVPPQVAALVEMVHDSGLQSSVSFAPLLAKPGSALGQSEPRSALHNPSGAPISVETSAGSRLVLDATHPATAAWLRSVIDALLSLDVAEVELTGLALAAVRAGDAVYERRGTTARGHIREALAVLHSVAMPNLDIIAVDGLLGPAIGLTDLVAVDGTQPGLPTAAAMLNSCRSTPAIEIPFDAPAPVIRRAAATAAVSASGVILTGNPRDASEETTIILRSVLPPGGLAGALESGDPPDLEAWRAPVAERFATLAIVNNGEDAEWLAVTEFVDAGETAFDPWSGRVLDRGDVLLPAGDAALWQVSAPAADPQIAGDTGHVARERLDLRVVSGRLHVENEDSESRLVAVNVRGRIELAVLEPGEKRWFD